MKMKVIIDLDSTVADLSSAWYGAINKDHEAQHGKLDEKNIKSWAVHEQHPIGKDVYKYLAIPGLFRNLKPLEGALNTLQDGAEYFRDEHYIATDAVTPLAVIEKREWVNEHMPWIKEDNIFILDKDSEFKKVDIAKKIGAHVAIDDAPHHVTDFSTQKPDMGIACIGYEYNTSVAGLCDCYVHPKFHNYNFIIAWSQIESFLDHKRKELSVK